MRPERRRNIRFAPKGTAVVTHGEHSQRARIANLSRSGIMLATRVTAPATLLGRTVDVDLRLDGKSAEWIRVSGEVLRIGANSIAIELQRVPSAFVEFVDDNSTASHVHVRVLSVVMVDATLDRRLAMAEAFRATGCSVVDVSTPLEAVVRLGESQFEPELIVIADSLPTSTSDELRRFVEREHPLATLVTIGDGLIEPSGLLHWLSSANPDDDLIARVRELLSRPIAG